MIFFSHLRKQSPRTYPGKHGPNGVVLPSGSLDELRRRVSFSHERFFGGCLSSFLLPFESSSNTPTLLAFRASPARSFPLVPTLPTDQALCRFLNLAFFSSQTLLSPSLMSLCPPPPPLSTFTRHPFARALRDEESSFHGSVSIIPRGATFSCTFLPSLRGQCLFALCPVFYAPSRDASVFSLLVS